MLSMQRYPGHAQIAGSTLYHCANLSIAAFATHSNVWAAWCCSQRQCWLALSRRRAGQVCAALLAVGSITPTTAHTLRSAQLRLPHCRRFDTCVSHSTIICGCVDTWMFAAYVVGCLHICRSRVVRRTAFQFWLLACCLLHVARCLVPMF